jgi:hypothetical protein
MKSSIEIDKGYDKEMKIIWDIKNKIYEEIENEGGIDKYFEYLEKNIKDLKKRFENKLV